MSSFDTDKQPELKDILSLKNTKITKVASNSKTVYRLPS